MWCTCFGKVNSEYLRLKTYCWKHIWGDISLQKLWSVPSTNNPAGPGRTENKVGPEHFFLFICTHRTCNPPCVIVATRHVSRLLQSPNIFDTSASRFSVTSHTTSDHPWKKSAGVYPLSVLIGWSTYPPSIDPHKSKHRDTGALENVWIEEIHFCSEETLLQR